MPDWMLNLYVWAITKGYHTIGGLMGSVLLLGIEPPKTYWRAFVVCVAGVMVASFGAPALAKSLSIDSAEVIGFFGFVLGLGGIYLSQLVIGVFKAWQANPAGIAGVLGKGMAAIFKRLTGGGQ